MLALQMWRVLSIQILPDVIHGNTSIFSPDGTPAHSIFGLSMLVLSITLGIFLLVGGCSTISTSIGLIQTVSSFAAPSFDEPSELSLRARPLVGYLMVGLCHAGHIVTFTGEEH